MKRVVFNRSEAGLKLAKNPREERFFEPSRTLFQTLTKLALDRPWGDL
jgi:hypothetical protein